MTDHRSADHDLADAPDWDALARHAAGEGTPEESQAVAAWLAAHPAEAVRLAALEQAVARAIPAADAGRAIDVEAALARMAARRRAATPAPPRVERGGSPARASQARSAQGRGMQGRANAERDTRLRVITGVLAVAAALGAVAIGLHEWEGSERATGATVARPVPGALRTVAAGGTIATAVGARDSLRLPDGTRVVLAPGSRLAVAADYGASAREVMVEGEAMFSVRHDAARPFAVHAGAAIARDVGTTFTVRTDGVDGERGVGVTVMEGIVALRASTAPATGETTLAAGDRAVLGGDGTVRAERGVAEPGDTAWARGRLDYRAAPLALVRADLRRWYGVELEVPDAALAGRRLTATFDGEPVGRVLDVIALALGGRIEKAGNRAVLRANGTAGP